MTSRPRTPLTSGDGYRLASYRSVRGPRAGAVVAGRVYDVAALTAEPEYATVADVLDDWDRAHDALAEATAAPTMAPAPVERAVLLTPVTRPGAIYCIGSNYHDHAEEMRLAGGRPPQPDAKSLGQEPFFFLKSSHAVVGPGAVVRLSDYSQQPDWELELVVVIGRTARDVSPAAALDCVAGYTIGNDLSARDLRARPDVPDASLFRADWLRHKSFDGAAPMGPWITPAAYVDSPGDLAMKLWVNEELKQDSCSSRMIFTPAEQIASLSRGLTLHPGDLVMTGTPAGVGHGSGEYLAVGDVVRTEIAQLGQLSFTIT